MSDLKRACPACEAWTSSVGVAFRDGEPCPYCGLPADAAGAFDRAVARGADEDLAARMAKAEQRAADAERKAARLADALDAIRREVKRATEEPS